MKKFSFIGSVLLLATVVTFLFIGCQKESAITDEQTTVSDGGDGAVLKATDGGSSGINGLISEENGRLMAAEWERLNPPGRTVSVRYATKDLINYLRVLNNKYKSDSVYVTFGIYNKRTAHFPSQIGRSTVFFMGNKMGDDGVSKTRGTDADDSESSNYLNGGVLNPL